MHLVGLWRDRPLTRVLSSPYVRCTQTVEPLASAVGLEVEEIDALAEGHAQQAQHLVQSLVATDAALCTHGDIIPAVLQHLEAAGVRIVSQWQWSKSSTWVLHADNGEFSHATYVPKPL